MSHLAKQVEISRSHRSHLAKHVRSRSDRSQQENIIYISQILQFPTRQTCVDHAHHTDPTRANILKDLDHTYPSRANMYARARSHRFHRGKRVYKTVQIPPSKHDVDPTDPYISGIYQANNMYISK